MDNKSIRIKRSKKLNMKLDKEMKLIENSNETSKHTGSRYFSDNKDGDNGY